MNSKMISILLAALVGSAAVSVFAVRSKNAAVESAGEVTGVVRKGTSVVGDAVVSVVEVSGSYRPPSGVVTMDQLHKVFIPHVLAVMKGTTVRFHNSDPFYHNVFSSSRVRTFNVSQANAGDYTDVAFPSLGVVPVRCHVHPNMRAYVVVLPNPFFSVTNSAGVFHITGLSAGTYTLKVWSEEGSTVQAITVPASGKAKVDISL